MDFLVQDFSGVSLLMCVVNIRRVIMCNSPQIPLTTETFSRAPQGTTEHTLVSRALCSVQTNLEGAMEFMLGKQRTSLK